MLRQARDYPRRTTDISGQRADGIDATVNHVIDGPRVDTRAVHEGAQGVRTEVRRVDARERPLLLADRRPDGIDDISFGSCVGHD